MSSLQTDKRTLRQFGAILGGIILGIAGIRFLRGHTEGLVWFISAGAVSAFFALCCPVVLKPFFIVFTYVGKIVGWINTRILLSIVFYGIITPVGVIMRLCGKDALERRIDKKAASYWHIRSTPIYPPQHYEKQF